VTNVSFALPNKELSVAVVMGGVSAEREVSLRSGEAVIKALKNNGVQVLACDGVKQLMKNDVEKFDAVFNILHGEAGENGELAGLLSQLNVNCTGSDMTGAVLSWHKDIAKTLVEKTGLKTPGSQLIFKSNELKQEGSGPWIIKPTQEGSSVGLYYAQTQEQLEEAVAKALVDVNSILVESFIKGTECTVAIVEDKVLPVIRIEPAVGMYDYKAKYESSETQYFCPSGFDDALNKKLQEQAMKAFKVLKLKGWGRVDFIVDEHKIPWFLEANTTPGMTKTSLVPKAAKAMGWSFDELVMHILATAFKESSHE